MLIAHDNLLTALHNRAINCILNLIVT